MSAKFADYSEYALVEQPAIELFAALGWQTANLYQEKFGLNGTEGRESEHQVILPKRKDQVLFIDARHIFRQIDRAHREFAPEQIG